MYKWELKNKSDLSQRHRPSRLMFKGPTHSLAKCICSVTVKSLWPRHCLCSCPYMWESCFCLIWILLLREGSVWQASGPMTWQKDLSWALLLSPAAKPRLKEKQRIKWECSLCIFLHLPAEMSASSSFILFRKFQWGQRSIHVPDWLGLVCTAWICTLTFKRNQVDHYLTVCRTSCVLASGLVGRGNHSNLYSSSSRRWPLFCSWHTIASFWSHPPPAASLTPSAFSPQPPTVLSPAPNSASSLPWSTLHLNKIKID